MAELVFCDEIIRGIPAQLVSAALVTTGDIMISILVLGVPVTVKLSPVRARELASNLSELAELSPTALPEVVSTGKV